MKNPDDQPDFIQRVKNIVSSAEDYVVKRQDKHRKAREYFDGVMTDQPPDEGRSSAVIRTIRAQYQKLMPSLRRTLLGSDEIVEYVPVQPNDTEIAGQASDYINKIVLKEADGVKAIKDSLADAIKIGTGILIAYWDERTEIRASQHTGLTPDEAMLLASEPGTEVLSAEMSEDGSQTIRIKRTISQGKIRAECVPPDEFLISPTAINEDDASIVGRKRQLTRSTLIAMGVDSSVIADAQPSTATTERLNDLGVTADVAFENDELDYYDLFVRLDLDGDGISELRHMCFVGDITEEALVENDYADMPLLVAVRVKEREHEFEGVSLYDDLAEVQRIMTFLARETFDNVKWQNTQMLAYAEGSVQNVDAIFNPEFGKVIRIRNGTSVRDAVQFLPIPSVSQANLDLISWFKKEGEERTGINDAAGGLPPDALQNVTAKATAIIEQMGISQVEEMAHTAARGLAKFFRLILRLTIQHQDKERTVRLRDKWVSVDPRQWNADMDCTVNTGLGAGSKERDMMAMSMVLQAQREVLTQLGQNNPLVNLDNLKNALTKLAESAGLKTPSLYFGQPGEAEISEYQQRMAEQPSPDEIKAKAQAELQIQIKKMDVEAELQKAQIRAQVDQHKEYVQSQAAVDERRAITEIEESGRREDRDLDRYKADLAAYIELQKLEVSAATKGKPDTTKTEDGAATDDESVADDAMQAYATAETESEHADA